MILQVLNICIAKHPSHLLLSLSYKLSFQEAKRLHYVNSASNFEVGGEHLEGALGVFFALNSRVDGLTYFKDELGCKSFSEDEFTTLTSFEYNDFVRVD